MPMLRLNHQSPEMLAPHPQIFPARNRVPEVPDALHVRDTRFLLLMVTGYVFVVLGGVFLLNVISPAVHRTGDMPALSDKISE